MPNISLEINNKAELCIGVCAVAFRIVHAVREIHNQLSSKKREVVY